MTIYFILCDKTTLLFLKDKKIKIIKVSYFCHIYISRLQKFYKNSTLLTFFENKAILKRQTFNANFCFIFCILFFQYLKFSLYCKMFSFYVIFFFHIFTYLRICHL